MEVKFSLFTLNSKEPEVPYTKAWWCCGIGNFFKESILFPWVGNDINTSVAGDSNTSDIVHISESCYSCILNLINKRNPPAFAIAEVTR